MAEDHQLPRKVEQYLAALSRMYEHDSRRPMQEIIVNAQTRVAEGWTYDNWNGGTYGHAVYLVVPELLFILAAKKRDEIQNKYATTSTISNFPERAHRRGVLGDGGRGGSRLATGIRTCSSLTDPDGHTHSGRCASGRGRRFPPLLEPQVGGEEAGSETPQG